VADLEADSAKPLSTAMQHQVIKLFESKCTQLKQEHCLCCRRVGIRLRLGSKGVCSDCSKYKDIGYFERRRCLPIWYLRGVPQYHVPEELTSLTLAEKMLIQLASPFIPLQHIKNGVFGLAGHVCCFEQNVSGFVNTLPRKHTDVTLLEVLKTVKAEIGCDEERTEVYKVRRRHVASALRWLKEYNVEYHHINIDMSALDWLEGDEGRLEVHEVGGSTDLVTAQDDANGAEADLGPSAQLTRTTVNVTDSVKEFGYVNDAPSPILSPEDCRVNNGVLAAIIGSPNKAKITVEWPATGPSACEPGFQHGGPITF
jgi:hypothetical protein